MSNELAYWNALKRIAAYLPAHQVKKSAPDFGLWADEAVEEAYENIIQEAKSALRGKRKPKDAA